jgi:beta-galactosidase
MLAWAGFDYHSLRGARPANIKWAGVADAFRVPKLGAAFYQAQVDPKVRPVIVPVFFWEPGGAQPAAGPDAMIASNCEQLSIFVNGRHLMTALPATGSPLYRHLPYPPFLVTLPGPVKSNSSKNKTPKNNGLGNISVANIGAELHIVGYVGGQQVAEVRMSSNPAGDHLAMTADDAAITADGTDATRIVFRGVDAFGNQRRVATGLVSLTIHGPGEIIGDNPFEFGAYGGLGAVWVRSLAGKTGTIVVSAAHPALGEATVRVQSDRPDTARSPV